MIALSVILFNTRIVAGNYLKKHMKHDKAVVTVFPGFCSSFHPEGSQSVSPFHLMKMRTRERVTWVPVCLTSACSPPRSVQFPF